MDYGRRIDTPIKRDSRAGRTLCVFSRPVRITGCNRRSTGKSNRNRPWPYTARNYNNSTRVNYTNIVESRRRKKNRKRVVPVRCRTCKCPACNVDFEYGMERDLKFKFSRPDRFCDRFFFRKRETFVDNRVFKLVSVGFFWENTPVAVFYTVGKPNENLYFSHKTPYFVYVNKHGRRQGTHTTCIRQYCKIKNPN